MIMKAIFKILFLVCLAACQYHDASVQSALRLNFSEAQGKPITTGDPSFQVLVVAISDSRCPSYVYCIWAGVATVSFQIGVNEFLLKIGESKIFSVGQKNYKLTLKDVTPYPNGGNEGEEKKAVFILEKI